MMCEEFSLTLLRGQAKADTTVETHQQKRTSIPAASALGLQWASELLQISGHSVSRP